MNIEIDSERKNVWPYIVWPPIILNIGSIVLVSIIYAFKYATTTPHSPETVQIGSGQIQFALSIFIFIVEWLFALLLLYKYRKASEPVRGLFSSTGTPLKFRWAPAIVLFVVSNILFVVYIFYLISTRPDLSYHDMSPIQVTLLLLLTPITAAFTEETIWRGHIISGLELRGNASWATLLISSASFALIHGVFIPDKLLVTFLLGIIYGIYYLRERSLLPIMLTHWFIDVWSFGIFFFR